MEEGGLRVVGDADAARSARILELQRPVVDDIDAAAADVDPGAGETDLTVAANRECVSGRSGEAPGADRRQPPTHVASWALANRTPANNIAGANSAISRTLNTLT